MPIFDSNQLLLAYTPGVYPAAEIVLQNVLQTDAKTAEMSKLVENSFRDVNIAFAI